MKDLISILKKDVIKESKNPNFIHHKWFAKYHLSIVEKIASELCNIYPSANSNIVQILVWMHDYGKILDFDNQYDKTIIDGRKKLQEVGFSEEITDKVIKYIEIMDRKNIEEIKNSPIEIQIISSADGAAHYVGPFHYLWWYENSGKEYTELMEDAIRKAMKDWNQKIVLPEVREKFEYRHKMILEQSGQLPNKYL